MDGADLRSGVCASNRLEERRYRVRYRARVPEIERFRFEGPTLSFSTFWLQKAPLFQRTPMICVTYKFRYLHRPGTGSGGEVRTGYRCRSPSGVQAVASTATADIWQAAWILSDWCKGRRVLRTSATGELHKVRRSLQFRLEIQQKSERKIN